MNWWNKMDRPFEDEALKISMQQSLTAKAERLAKQQGMKRPLTPNEEYILEKGLKESEIKETKTREKIGE